MENEPGNLHVIKMKLAPAVIVVLIGACLISLPKEGDDGYIEGKNGPLATPTKPPATQKSESEIDLTTTITSTIRSTQECSN